MRLLRLQSSLGKPLTSTARIFTALGESVHPGFGGEGLAGVLASAEMLDLSGSSTTGTTTGGGTTATPEILVISPTQGAIGTHITIQGRNFSPNPAENVVAVNGTPATILNVVTSAAVHYIEAEIATGTTTGPGQPGSGSSIFQDQPGGMVFWMTPRLVTPY